MMREETNSMESGVNIFYFTLGEVQFCYLPGVRGW